MRLSFLMTFALTAMLGLVAGPVGAVMVDFESPTYTAGSTFDGVDGWARLLEYGGTVVVTPDVSDTTVLAGSQSGRITGNVSTPQLSVMARQFDAGGPTEFGTGSILSGYMQVSGPDGRAEFFYSDDPYAGTSPCGISANIDTGNFELYGKVGAAANYIATGVPVVSGKNYLLELELDLTDQSFDAYATNVTDAGPRVLLGSEFMSSAAPIVPSMYPTSGHAIVTRGGAVAVYDDLDVYAAPADPPVLLLSEPIDFEDPIYVAGSSVVGVDGWIESIWVADATISDTSVLEGTKSLRLTGVAANAALQRNFGDGSTYGTGSIISTRMMLEGAAGGTGELYFSHDQAALATPGGIAGTLGGNFAIFGLNIAEANTVACEAGVEYLLEVELDLENQTFDSYVTNLTAGGERTLLGEASLYATVEPGDGTNAGYVLITRGSVGIFDELNVAVPEPTAFAALAGLLFGVLALRRRC